MRVRDVMRKEVRTIQPNEPASTAREMFRRYDIHHLVVVDRKSVIGLLADRDLMDVGADTPVQRAMAHPPVTITPDETVRKAAALMTGHVIGSLPVVDDGKLVGISRAVTDFHYCTYLSDLAVDQAHQGCGIGRELIRKTHEAAGLHTTLILIAAPKARTYYPHIGMEYHDSCWIIRGKTS